MAWRFRMNTYGVRQYTWYSAGKHIQVSSHPTTYANYNQVQPLGDFVYRYDADQCYPNTNRNIRRC